MTNPATEQYLRLLKLCTDGAPQLKELREAGVSSRRIANLYPFDFQAFLPQISRRLSPFQLPALVRDIHKPLGALRLRQQGLRDSWGAYYATEASRNHTALLAALPRSERPSGSTLLDVHDALWCLGNWADVEESVLPNRNDLNNVGIYVQRWCQWLVPEQHSTWYNPASAVKPERVLA